MKRGWRTSIHIVAGLLGIMTLFLLREIFLYHEHVALVTLAHGQTLFLETAQTSWQKMRGLSGTSEVPRDGMLFDYRKEPEDVGIWMKDMNYPIDIVFIAGGVVVQVVEGAEPDDSPERPIYRAGGDVEVVLELPSGRVKEWAIEVGDKVVMN